MSIADVCLAISAIVTPITVMVATIVVARIQYATKASVDLGNVATNAVHDAVRTSNGETIGEIAESVRVRNELLDEQGKGPT